MTESRQAAAVAEGAPPESAPKVAKSRPSQRRFDRLIRLVSVPGFDRLEAAHVIVFGLGGVGGYAAEALARSGVGTLTLVDFDRVCATNVNRQIQALATTVGGSKAGLLAERVRDINGRCEVRPVEAFYNAAAADRLLPLDDRPTWVIDAIDNVSAKMHLMDRCRGAGIPLISSMGAAGKLDPTAVRVADLYQTHTDPLARVLRKRLRKEYDWPRHDPRQETLSGVQVVFSTESRRKPLPPNWDDAYGFQCICPHGDNGLHSCDQRNLIEGSAIFVTATFGLAAASLVVRAIAGDDLAPTLDEAGQAPGPTRGRPGARRRP